MFLSGFKIALSFKAPRSLAMPLLAYTMFKYTILFPFRRGGVFFFGEKGG